MLADNEIAGEEKLRQYTFSQLVSYIVPSQIVFIDEIPKSASGKTLRIGLGNKLVDKLKPVYVPPKEKIG